MVTYNWKDDKTKMLRMLRNSKTLKEKYGWSREVGAGFVKDDICYIGLRENGKLLFKFGWGHTQVFMVKELNLRETEEAIKYLEAEA